MAATTLIGTTKVGPLIKEARKQKGYSQMELSLKMDYTYNAACHWESGYKKLTPEEAIKIVDILSLPPDTFENLQDELMQEADHKSNKGSRLDPVVNEAIRSLRENKKMTVKEFALKVGIVPSHLSRIESNISNPTIQQIKEIKRVYGVSYEHILENDSKALPSKELQKRIKQLEEENAQLKRINEALLKASEGK